MDETIKPNKQSSVPTGQAGRGRSTLSESNAPSDLINRETCAPSDLVSLEQKIHTLAKPRPIYTPKSLHPVSALSYDWTGWLSGGADFPATTQNAIREAAPLWKSDGLHFGEFRIAGNSIQILFKASHYVRPVFCTARVKGRLQHALRKAGTPVRFSRKVSFRSLGENIRGAVEGYLGKQVRKEGFVDPRFIRRMAEYTITSNDTDLSLPAETNSGLYWYNLHMVLVVDGRRRITDYKTLGAIRDTTCHIAKERGYRLKSLSVMPDHIHAALGGDIDQSPETIVLTFLNNLAYVLGQNRIWQDRYYVGTFSEYDMKAIRRLAQ